MASQLYLFETTASPQKDGSFVVRPQRLIDGKEISAQKAAGLLGFKDKETIFRLVELGEIKGWKPKSKRNNGKYRIDLGSVMDYKARRLAESRGD
jgi:hypothetical protein